MARKHATTKTYGDVILHLAGAGRSIKEIACTLYLATSTVAACLHEIAATAPADKIQAAIALFDDPESEVAR